MLDKTEKRENVIVSKLKSLFIYILVTLLLCGASAGSVYYWQNKKIKDERNEVEEEVKQEYKNEIEQLENSLDQCKTEKDAITLEIIEKIEQSKNEEDDDDSEEEVENEDLLNKMKELVPGLIVCADNELEIAQPKYQNKGGGYLCDPEIGSSEQWPELPEDYQYGEVKTDKDSPDEWSFSIYKVSDDKVTIRCNKDGCFDCKTEKDKCEEIE